MRTLERGLGILAYVQQHGQVTRTDIVTDLGIPTSTVYRYLTVLVRSGYLVEFDNLVVASQRLADMSRDRDAELKKTSAPFLESLAARTRQSVALTVRMNLACLCLSVHRAQYAVTTHREGRALALYAGASATPLLAMAPDDIRERVLSGRLTAFTSRTPGPEQIRTEIEEVRRDGFHMTTGWIASGMTAVGVPVMAGGSCACALSVIGSARQMPTDPRDIVGVLESTAARLSARIAPES